jgi:hypothetical protein
MSQDNPAFVELLRTVREFIDDITPKLEGQDRYHGLVASYLLSITERESALGEAIDREEAAALAACTGTHAPLPEAWATLARDIRRGQCDERWDELMTLVTSHVVNKVRVSKPDHLHPMHGAATPQPEAT